MAYVEEIRALVGHRPLIMVGTAVLIANAAGELLLVRRQDNDEWNLPGGYMEPGETLEETARREARVETGLAVSDLAFFEVLSGPDCFYEYPNGDQVYSVAAVYVATAWHGEPRSDRAEVQELRFFAPQQLPRPLGKAAARVIRRYAGDGRGAPAP